MNNVATMREFLRSAGADLSAIEFSVLATLLLHCNTEGQCWPSSRTIADFCRVSEKSARRALDGLASRGLITRTARRAAGGGRLSDLIYIKLAQAPASPAERPLPKRREVVHGVLCWGEADAAAVSELVVAHGAATVEAAAERLRRRGVPPLPSRVAREIQAAGAAARRAETRPPRMADDAPVPPPPAMRAGEQEAEARIARQLRELPKLRGTARAQLAGRLAQVLPLDDPRRALLLL